MTDRWPDDDLLAEYDSCAARGTTYLIESDSAPHAAPRPVDRFRNTAVGAVVAAGMLGLRDALEGRPEREEVAIVRTMPDRPTNRDARFVFDPDEPTRVTVIVPHPSH
ncbi:MAG: hypothetical protein FJW86_12340 [Actinobacteria bacterium]|nr:hypothetical protein [Actinomycetota bacterium]